MSERAPSTPLYLLSNVANGNIHLIEVISVRMGKKWMFKIFVTSYRSSHSLMLFKKGVLKCFAVFTRKHPN